MHSRAQRWVLLGALFLSLACTKTPREPSVLQIRGATMGTFYHVQVVDGKRKGEGERVALKRLIDKRLNKIVAQMSTYEPDSSITQFNHAAAGHKFDLEPEFSKVLHAAEAINKLSGGAFDPTLDPLINLWGFDKSGRRESPPSHQAIKVALGKVGFDKIGIQKNSVLKKVSTVTLNLSSIAKGFAVDEIFRLLRKKGHENFMVEVGGEIRVCGESADGDPWLIALMDPRDPESSIIQLEMKSGEALATSGTYLNKFDYSGKGYSHIIDPRTGYPVKHRLQSVTVIAKSAMQADALATAALVMGETLGKKMLDGLGVKSYFLSRPKKAVRISSGLTP